MAHQPYLRDDENESWDSRDWKGCSVMGREMSLLGSTGWAKCPFLCCGKRDALSSLMHRR
jgi:hypothetical protein